MRYTASIQCNSQTLVYLHMLFVSHYQLVDLFQFVVFSQFLADRCCNSLTVIIKHACVCLLSMTFVYCDKMAEARITVIFVNSITVPKLFAW